MVSLDKPSTSKNTHPLDNSHQTMEHRRQSRRNSRVSSILESVDDDVRHTDTHAVDWELPIAHYEHFLPTVDCHSPIEDSHECHPPSPLSHEIVQETRPHITPSLGRHISWPAEAQMPHCVHCAKRTPAGGLESQTISYTKSQDDCCIRSEVVQGETPILSVAHPHRHHQTCEAVGIMPPLWDSLESESSISEFAIH